MTFGPEANAPALQPVSSVFSVRVIANRLIYVFALPLK